MKVYARSNLISKSYFGKSISIQDWNEYFIQNNLINYYLIWFESINSYYFNSNRNEWQCKTNVLLIGKASIQNRESQKRFVQANQRTNELDKIPTLSLSSSISLTYSHTHALLLSLSHTHTHTLSISNTHTLLFFLTYSYTLYLSLSLSHTHTHTN